MILLQTPYFDAIIVALLLLSWWLSMPLIGAVAAAAGALFYIKKIWDSRKG